MFESVIDKLEQAAQLLREADTELESERAQTAAPAPTLAAVADTPEEPEPEHLAFKCPGCGAEYAAAVVCANQHPAEQTLPTAQVLDGAAPTGVVEQPAVVEAPAEQPDETGAGPSAESPSPAPPATPVPPTTPAWPS